MTAYTMPRRELLRLCGAAGAASLLGRIGMAENLAPAETAADHLLLGVADLDQGVAWFEKLTGVKAAVGGSHPGRGTRNALASLGGRRYLEIIAPDPLQTAYNFDIDLRKLKGPRLITWAARTADIEVAAKKAREAGLQVSGPSDGSRARPDGRVLRWKTLGVQTEFGRQGVEPIPFLIEWAGDSPHPSQDSPRGCELRSFEMEHPEPADVTEVLRKLGIGAQVGRAEGVRLRATLKTPKGEVELK